MGYFCAGPFYTQFSLQEDFADVVWHMPQCTILDLVLQNISGDRLAKLPPRPLNILLKCLWHPDPPLDRKYCQTYI